MYFTFEGPVRVLYRSRCPGPAQVGCGARGVVGYVCERRLDPDVNEYLRVHGEVRVRTACATVGVPPVGREGVTILVGMRDDVPWGRVKGPQWWGRRDSGGEDGELSVGTLVCTHGSGPVGSLPSLKVVDL